jgi:hypothetical protein
MTEHHVSLRELARRTSYDPGYLSKVLAGRKPPSAALAQALDAALDAHGELVALVASPELAAVDNDNPLLWGLDWLTRDAPYNHRTRGTVHVTDTTIAEIDARIRHLRRLDDVAPAGTLIDPVTRELSAVVDLVRDGSHATDVERQLLGLVAELGQLAGWVCEDAGQHGRAERLYLVGAQAARDAGCGALVAHNLSSMAYGMANRGELDRAVAIARTAVIGAPRATVRERVLFRDRLAWASALAADARECEQVLAEVAELHERDEPGDEPDITYWVSRDESEIMAARCWTELHRPLRAVPRLSTILTRYSADHVRERALYTSWLAAALADANELDAAARAAADTLELADRCDSDRVRQRVAVVEHRLIERGLPIPRR